MASSDLAVTRVTFAVEGLGTFGGRLLRFLAPKTVDSIVRGLPLTGRVTQMQSGFYFQVGLRLGVEKAQTSFRRADIAYWPLAGAVCWFCREANLYMPASRIGTLDQPIDIAERAKSGQRVSLVTQQPRGRS